LNNTAQLKYGLTPASFQPRELPGGDGLRILQMAVMISRELFKKHRRKN
jgi:hypothetical protein